MVCSQGQVAIQLPNILATALDRQASILIGMRHLSTVSFGFNPQAGVPESRNSGSGPISKSLFARDSFHYVELFAEYCQPNISPL